MKNIAKKYLGIVTRCTAEGAKYGALIGIIGVTVTTIVAVVMGLIARRKGLSTVEYLDCLKKALEAE